MGTRVPPPGSGTFNVPSNYYNGPKAGTASAPVPSGNANAVPSTAGTTGRTVSYQQGQVPNEVAPASYQIPTVDQLRSGINNTAGAVLNDMTGRANQAIQNGTARAADTVQQYTGPVFDSAPPAFAPSASSSQSISDGAPLPSTTEAAPPKLEWQSPR